MIKIANVSKHYGSFQVLGDCTTSVSSAKSVVVCKALPAPAKSTLIKCVNGLEPFQAGEIIDRRHPVGDRNQPSAARARVGMVFQNFELFPHMSIN